MITDNRLQLVNGKVFNKMRNEIETVLNNMPRIDKFLNVPYNNGIVQEFDNGNDFYNEELKSILDSFIKFESEYNEDFNTYLI